MAERADISVDWSQSPRIIWVNWTDEASKELTLQDLHDTAKGILEYDMLALDDSILLESEGKAELGEGQQVAITTTLQNAVVAFRQNINIDAEGTATSEDLTGTLLTDTNATFISSGVKAGAHVHNETDNSMSTVLKVVSEMQLRMVQLATGSTNQWQIGDAYDIINPARCSVSGGNLVAVDANGDPMDQFLPTTNVFVTLTSSASATFTDITVFSGTVAAAVLEESVSAHSGVVGSLADVVDEIYQARLSVAQQAALDNDLPLVRKALVNRLELADGSSNNWILYDDDDTNPIRAWHVTSKTGGAISIPAGSPARRTPV